MELFKKNPLADQFDMVSDSSINKFVAGQALAQYRIVVLDTDARMVYADHKNVSHAGKIIGLTMADAAMDAVIVVRSFGLVENPSWNWNIIKPNVFLSTNGNITQTPPTSGFACVIGSAVSAERLLIRIQPSTTLINQT